MNPRTSQEPPALSGMVSCGFHILGAQKRPHHLSQTLKAKPQILLCYPPYKIRRIGGGQRHPRVLLVPGASAGGIRRPLFGLELRRVPLTPRPAGLDHRRVRPRLNFLNLLLPGQQLELLPWQPQSFLQKEGGRGGATVERAGHTVLVRQ